MNTIELLAAALGLAALSGINLYLTVFATGLAVHFHWIHLAEKYQSLEILGDPVVLTVAGTLYFLEFFADKVPWVDSLWDTIHTVIRPIGGAFLAIRVLGTPDPMFDVLIALLGGSVALATHSVKAGTRLVANASPEPFSNITLSLLEDGVVLGGLVLIHTHPVVAFALLLLAVGSALWYGPIILRKARLTAWLAWRKLNSPAEKGKHASLSKTLPPDADMLLHRTHAEPPSVEWVLPCAVTRGTRSPAGSFGWLVGTANDTLLFIPKKRFGGQCTTISLPDHRSFYEPGFLGDAITVYQPKSKTKITFTVDRPRSELTKQAYGWIQERTVENAPAPVLAEAVA